MTGYVGIGGPHPCLSPEVRHLGNLAISFGHFYQGLGVFVVRWSEFVGWESLGGSRSGRGKIRGEVETPELLKKHIVTNFPAKKQQFESNQFF